VARPHKKKITNKFYKYKKKISITIWMSCNYTFVLHVKINLKQYFQWFLKDRKVACGSNVKYWSGKTPNNLKLFFFFYFLQFNLRDLNPILLEWHLCNVVRRFYVPFHFLWNVHKLLLCTFITLFKNKMRLDRYYFVIHFNWFFWVFSVNCLSIYVFICLFVCLFVCLF
jgi:hypothetical protein